MENFWNDRYRSTIFAYGENPNEYFKSKIDKLQPGKALFPAEGEGRNAVYASKIGWEVEAFDTSKEGKNKAEILADKNNVAFNYQVGNIDTINLSGEKFDLIVLIYVHLPQEEKFNFYQKIISFLKPGGYIIFEAFNTNHINFNSQNPKVGGPKDISLLYSLEEIKNKLSAFEIIELKEEVIELHEGEFHNGQASVLRFFGYLNK